MKYINLKLHSEYSFLEGVGSLKEYVESIKNRITKKNDLMANVVITDVSERSEYFLFPREMNILGSLFKQEDICIFRYNKLDDDKYAIKDIQNIKNLKLKLKIEESFNKRDELIDLIKTHKGNNRIKIYKVENRKINVTEMDSKYNIEIN
ncbi:hypothetical protein [Pseudostreptobacillus hongkongensis]|uniref:hypothetical protein n=1 Tax=Pseudostreptobacillus hongkongensis TaxID=1162717 RepID=UPI0008379139|nr:hypothetical protein [Pseudostreptobacillus hongkongensis]